MMAETPTLASVIQRALALATQELRVSLPGIVVKYDAAKQMADVQPALKTRYEDGTVRLLPVVTNVPVGHPRANGAVVHLPLAAGDVVQIVFADRSLDKWLTEGGTVDPEDTRKHHLSDAWCIPGCYPSSEQMTIPDPTALTLLYGSSEVRIKKDGVVTVKGGTETHLGGLAPGFHAALGERVEARLASIESNLGTHTHPVTTAPGITGPQAGYVPDSSVVASSVVKVKD